MLKFETYDDAVYAHTSYVKFLRDHGPSVAHAWLTDRDNKYGQQAAVPSWIAWQHALSDALTTDICWMTTEIMDLVQSAMHDFDPAEKVTLDDIFIPSGFLVLPHSFLSKDVNGKTIGWRLLGWNTVDPMVKWVNTVGEGTDAYTYDLSMEGESEPGVRFMQMSWVHDDDDFTEENPELTEELRSQHEIEWGVAHATSIPLRYMSDPREVSGEGDRNASWLLFWRVFQKLAAEKIVKSERQHPGRPARRDAQRFKMPPPILRVIELRRTREYDPEGRENGSGRTYTHRWIVRGHWHTYHYKTGPRKRYIGEYVKGPEDLDLIVKQRVFNWTR